jgi:hypothetical protein
MCSRVLVVLTCLAPTIVGCGGNSPSGSPTSPTSPTPVAPTTPNPPVSTPLLTISGTVYADPDVITTADPTTFVSISFQGTADRQMFDRRPAAFVTYRAFIFRAQFSDGLVTEVQVNPEFGTSDLALVEAEKYAREVGRIPTMLRRDMDTMWIHKGDYAMGGGNRNILIHTDRARSDEARGALEEALFHEGTHTSLDSRHRSAAGWTAAQQMDGDFISTYARDNPNTEDLAETVVLWAALRFRPERLSPALINTIEMRIPNRLRYLDAQGFSSVFP